MTNIQSYKGLPLSVFVALSNDDGTTYDYTLYTYAGEVRSHVDNSLITALTVAGATDVDGEVGVQISLTDTATNGISAGIYKYDILQTETSSGAVVPAFSGDFIQAATVTAP